MDQKTKNIKEGVNKLLEDWEKYTAELCDSNSDNFIQHSEYAVSIGLSKDTRLTRNQLIESTGDNVGDCSGLFIGGFPRLVSSELIELREIVQANIAFYSLALRKWVECKKDGLLLTSLRSLEETILKIIDETLEYIQEESGIKTELIYARLDVLAALFEEDEEDEEDEKVDDDSASESSSSIPDPIFSKNSLNSYTGKKSPATNADQLLDEIQKKRKEKRGWCANDLIEPITNLIKAKRALNEYLVYIKKAKTDFLKHILPSGLPPSSRYKRCDDGFKLKIANHLIDLYTFLISDVEKQQAWLEACLASLPEGGLALSIIELGCFLSRNDPKKNNKLPKELVLKRGKITIADLFVEMKNVAAVVKKALEEATNTDGKMLLKKCLQEQLNKMEFNRIVIDTMKAVKWNGAELLKEATELKECIDWLEDNYTTLCDIIQEAMKQLKPSKGDVDGEAEWKSIYKFNTQSFNELQQKLFPKEKEEEYEDSEDTSTLSVTAFDVESANEFNTRKSECETLYNDYLKLSVNLTTNKNVHKSLSWLKTYRKDLENHRKKLDNYQINLRKRLIDLYLFLNEDEKGGALYSKKGHFMSGLNLLVSNARLMKAALDDELACVYKLVDKHKDARKAFSPLSLTLCFIVVVVAALLFLLPPIFFELGFVTLMTWAVGLFILGLAAFLAAWVPAVEGKETTRTVLRVIGVGLLATLGALAYGLMHIGIVYYMTQGAAVVGLTISTANIPAFIATTCVALKGFIAAHLLFLIPAIITPVLLILLACVVSHFVLKRNENEGVILGELKKSEVAFKARKVELSVSSRWEKARETFEEKLSFVQDTAAFFIEQSEKQLKLSQFGDQSKKASYKAVLGKTKNFWTELFQKLKAINVKNLGFSEIKEQIKALREWCQAKSTKKKKTFESIVSASKDDKNRLRQYIFTENRRDDAFQREIDLLEPVLNSLGNDCLKEALCK